MELGVTTLFKKKKKINGMSAHVLWEDGRERQKKRVKEVKHVDEENAEWSFVKVEYANEDAATF